MALPAHGRGKARRRRLSGPAIVRRLGRPVSGIGRALRRRGLGWRYLHVAIDDRRHLAFTQLLPSERRDDAAALLDSSLAWLAQHMSSSSAS